MKPILLACLLTAAPLAQPAVAGPSPQLVASVEVRMRYYGIHADLTGVPTSAVAQLHAVLNSGDDYLTKRRRLRTVLRNHAAPG